MTHARTRKLLIVGLVVFGLVAGLYVIRRPLLMTAPNCMAMRWHGCVDTFNGPILLMLIGLPLPVLVAWGLAKLRGGPDAWRKSVAEVGLIWGTVPWVWLTLQPGLNAGHVTGRVSLIPLRDLMTMGPIGIGGNLLVLAALGFFAPIRWATLASLPRILLLGAACSTLIETAQYVFRLDRVSSIDDVLVNTVGAGLFALASRRWWPKPLPSPAD